MREPGALREWQAAQCGWNGKSEVAWEDMRLEIYAGSGSFQVLDAIFSHVDFILGRVF